MKKLNIKEFSSIIGVSTATVSRAFNASGRINEKTRRYIIEKAGELGYHANIHARNLSSPRSNIAGLFYPLLAGEQPDYFINEIQQGVQSALMDSGILLQVHPFPARADAELTLETYRTYVLSGGLGAMIIVAGSAESVELVKVAREAEVPYVVIGHMSGETRYTVSFDNGQGARLAGKFFVRTGRRFPAYIGGHLDKRKKLGFLEGLGEISDKLTIHSGGDAFIHGANAFRELRANRPETDCVLCANDVLAAGFIKAAQESGATIPEDIAVIGFDDLSFARYLTPALSSVSLKLNHIGLSAARQILKLLDGNDITPEFVECELIFRDSA
ncbi:MAG: LacI family DNA-binding transcriptional regulator [Victivallales bacterium]|nr:LacI family DNA-binding transcriptional regulator [Victivallales bacterium]